MLIGAQGLPWLCAQGCSQQYPGDLGAGSATFKANDLTPVLSFRCHLKCFIYFIGFFLRKSHKCCHYLIFIYRRKLSFCKADPARITTQSLNFAGL